MVCMRCDFDGLADPRSMCGYVRIHEKLIVRQMMEAAQVRKHHSFSLSPAREAGVPQLLLKVLRLSNALLPSFLPSLSSLAFSG